MLLIAFTFASLALSLVNVVIQEDRGAKLGWASAAMGWLMALTSNL